MLADQTFDELGEILDQATKEMALFEIRLLGTGVNQSEQCLIGHPFDHSNRQK